MKKLLLKIFRLKVKLQLIYRLEVRFDNGKENYIIYNGYCILKANKLTKEFIEKRKLREHQSYEYIHLLLVKFDTIINVVNWSVIKEKFKTI